MVIVLIIEIALLFGFCSASAIAYYDEKDVLTKPQLELKLLLG